MIDGCETKSSVFEEMFDLASGAKKSYLEKQYEAPSVGNENLHSFILLRNQTSKRKRQKNVITKYLKYAF